MDSLSLIETVRHLVECYKKGVLKAETMPEDANPSLDPASEEALRYFTLPMALNYQRNSYALWQSALQTYQDDETRFLFDPEAAVRYADKVTAALLKYKIALQPNKHPDIWLRLCTTLVTDYEGKLSTFFDAHDWDMRKVLAVLSRNKKKFPYLCGPKISNYWLYVLSNYTAHEFKNLACLTVAPDTHVMQASIRLGLATPSCSSVKVAAAWAEVLQGTGISPIQIHTPLWLWSRQRFPAHVFY